MSRWWTDIFAVPFAWAPGLSWVVIYWMVVALIGLGFKVTNARASLSRLGSVTSDDPGAYRVQAITDLISQAILGTCLLFALIAGVLAGFGTHAGTPRDPARAVATTLVLELVVTAIASHAFLVWLGRTLTMRQLKARAMEDRLALVAVDPATLKIIGWTADAQGLFGWTSAEAVGQNVADLLIPLSWIHQHRDGVARWRETGEAPAFGQRMRVMVKTKAGAEVPVAMVLTAEQVGDRTSLIGRFRRRSALD